MPRSNESGPTRAEDYQMFDLHVLKGWPVKKVADFLSVTGNQVYQAKYRVSSLLEAQIKRLEHEMI